MTRPLVLLDVDGVLCPAGEAEPGVLHGGHPHRHGPEAAGYTDEPGMRVCWTPSLVERLVHLHRSGLVEVVWLTAWFRRALPLAEVIGLPTFTVTGEREQFADGWWKVTALDVVLAERPGQRFVWLDDDIDDDSRRHVADRYPGRGLLIAPHWMTGLTSEHLDDVERFVAA